MPQRQDRFVRRWEDAVSAAEKPALRTLCAAMVLGECKHVQPTGIGRILQKQPCTEVGQMQGAGWRSRRVEAMGNAVWRQEVHGGVLSVCGREDSTNMAKAAEAKEGAQDKGAQEAAEANETEDAEEEPETEASGVVGQESWAAREDSVARRWQTYLQHVPRLYVCD